MDGEEVNAGSLDGVDEVDGAAVLRICQLIRNFLVD